MRGVLRILSCCLIVLCGCMPYPYYKTLEGNKEDLEVVLVEEGTNELSVCTLVKMGNDSLSVYTPHAISIKVSQFFAQQGTKFVLHFRFQLGEQCWSLVSYKTIAPPRFEYTYVNYVCWVPAWVGARPYSFTV